MAITLDGSLGITTPGLTNTGTETIVNLTTTGNTILGNASTDTLNVGNGDLIKDASGNVGIGVTPSATGAGFKSLQVKSANIMSDGVASILYNNAYYTGTVENYIATGYAQKFVLNAAANGSYVWYTAPSGTAGNPITFTQAMTLDASGNLLVGQASGSYNIISKVRGSDNGEIVLSVERQQTGVSALLCYSVSQTNYNAANAANKMGRDATTFRSLNAGGTINASGADYAEYMTKASDFILAKGDVVGIDANGKLTNVFADAISFVVKSTDPSYVGGDSWGSGLEDNSEELEAARQLVDRIAFAGQVPVNVLGATAGQYIIPVNDNGAIKGEAISSPTFEQYQTAVGKVIAIEADGRAKIIVKVA